MIHKETKSNHFNSDNSLLEGWGRLLVSLAVVVITFFIFRWSIGFMKDEEAPKLAVMLVALAVGVFGVWGVFWIGNDLVSRLPSERLRERLLPFIFVGPALALLFVYLVYPALNTIVISLYDARSENFIGLENYIFAFTTSGIQTAFRNNILWIVTVTGVSVGFGLIIAVLVDKIRLEAVAKSFIFLPMAISFVGASVIWRFVYAFSPPGRDQIGILNALVTLFDGEPIGWLIQRSLDIGPITIPAFNTFALIAIMIWLQTGFCMVILSAALKGIPGEILEAARMDGATELQLFFQIIVPMIKGTIITVGTTVLIAVLKVFDVVFVMTSGKHETEVLANRMYAEMFRFRDFGHGSALAVILLVAVIPIMVINVRNLRQQRSI